MDIINKGQACRNCKNNPICKWRDGMDDFVECIRDFASVDCPFNIIITCPHYFPAEIACREKQTVTISGRGEILSCNETMRDYRKEI